VWRQRLLRPIFQTAVIWNIGWFVLQGTMSRMRCATWA
jgi:hypothetical protein